MQSQPVQVAPPHALPLQAPGQDAEPQTPSAEPHTNEPLTDIEVHLSGEDGNAFSILGRVRAALRGGGRSDLIESFTSEATSGDYDHLLAVCAKFVRVS